MDELREEVEVKKSFKKKLATSTWAGHLEKMANEKLTKRADAQNVDGKWRRGRPKF